MATTTETSGWIIFVITQDDEGPPNRRPIGPGNFIDGGWVDTDISAETDEVKAACAAAWTPAVLAAYKAAFPWVAPVAPVFENISKNIIWERMTDQEAVAADAALKAQPPKILRIYEGATYVSIRAQEYPLLLNAMTQLFGTQRAGEILAPNF